MAEENLKKSVSQKDHKLYEYIGTKQKLTNQTYSYKPPLSLCLRMYNLAGV